MAENAFHSLLRKLVEPFLALPFVFHVFVVAFMAHVDVARLPFLVWNVVSNLIDKFSSALGARGDSCNTLLPFHPSNLQPGDSPASMKVQFNYLKENRVTIRL